MIPVSKPTASTVVISPASFWEPEKLGPQTSWLAHAPFAFWIVETLKPSMLVELGTRGGFSYFVFCEAVQRCQLNARCYAVNSWKGDEQAGLYDEEVFEEVASYNARRYSEFSTLIRSTFDEALRHFEDHAIDLLHVSGRHFYDDVKHDFESWRQKLSDRSVVLFHETNVHQSGHHVFRLWEELRQTYPHFEFLHGHGLGVLAIGERIPKRMRLLFDSAGNENFTSQIRTAYSRLGLAVTLQLKTHEQAAELVQRNAGLRLIEGRLSHAARLNRQLSAELAQRSAEVDRLNRELSAELAQRGAEAQDLRRELAARSAEARRLEAECEARRKELEAIRLSSSWRVTAPLRWLRQGSTQALRFTKQSPVVSWWAWAFQRASRLRGRLQRGSDVKLIQSSSLFDRDWYLNQYPDVKTAAIDPVRHYLYYGATEGRNPGPLFDTGWYLERYTDVRQAGINPLLHYLRHGAAEGRIPTPRSPTGKLSS
jgi:hypothetical protein